MVFNRSAPIPLLAIAAGLALSCAPAIVPPARDRPAPPPTPLAPPTKYTLHGTFTSPQTQDGPLPIRAVFTSTIHKQHWEVVFHFRFNGAQHTVRGTAEGSLGEGALRGTIQNYRRRTYTFSGNFNGGVFNGTHALVSRGRAGGLDTGTLNTGTITLRTVEVSPSLR